MIRVPVALGDRSYSVDIQTGALGQAPDHLRRYARGRPLIVVTDENVASTQLEKLATSLKTAGIAVDPIVLPPGEGTKSWQWLERLVEELLLREVERADTIVALGGGVIGDLAGFAAAIVKRGCRFVQIPTTLLAQVDSSVGGKTAINATAGKNLVGAFHQPVSVLIDPLVLDSLPLRQIRAGYAEVVKYGLLGDGGFYDWCEANFAALLARDTAAREHAIVTSVRAKAAIVAADERETTGQRALLNLGHTFGHALEAAAGFSDKLLHGEAVAAGMALALRFSARRGECSGQDAMRVRHHLAAAGLPTSAAEAGIVANGAQLVEHMRHDKKMSSGRLPFILARGIGQAFLAHDIPLEDVVRFLDDDASAR